MPDYKNMFDFSKLERELKERGKSYTLDNGIAVLAEDTPGLGLAVGTISIEAGANVEKPEDAGVMHFLEHMLFEGSRHYRDPSAREYDSALLGLETNANTSHTNIRAPIKGANESGYLLPEVLPSAFRIVADTVYHPLLPLDKIEKQRKIIQRERIEREIPHKNDIFDAIVRTINIRLYQNNPLLNRKVIGTQESIDQLTSQTLHAYHTLYFVGRNSIVVLAGDLRSSGDLESMTKEILGDIPAGEVSQKLFKEETPFAGTEELSFASPIAPTAIVHLYFRMPSPYHPDLALTRTLSEVLFKPPLGLLYRKLREEKNLVYGIKTKFMGHGATEYLNVEYLLDPAKIQESLAVVESCFQQVKAGDFAEDIIRATKAAVLPEVICEFTRPGWIAKEFEYHYMAAKYSFQSSRIANAQKYLTLTKGDIIDVANKYLAEDRLVCIVS